MDEHVGLNLPEAPAWSIALGSIGRGAIWVGLAFFVLSVVLGLTRKESRWHGLTFIAGCLAIFSSLATLATLFIKDRFEYTYVYQRSDTVNPLKYKFASIWSGQEGSFLLWAVAAAIFGLLAYRGLDRYKRWFLLTYSGFLATLCGILSYESPFNLQPLFEGKIYVPPNGVGLSPTLQNYWIVIHPPTIFLGFGSLTVLFAYSVSALMSRDFDQWANRMRPWAIVSTTLVGLGLCMGGFWAYETLGWGGFWMWDPVENVSFVPWVLSAALIHGLIVQATKKKWAATNALFAALPFLAFVYGTFLTRAGFLDGASVHSFAQMNPVAHKVLLAFFGVTTVGYLTLWATRLRSLRVVAPSERGLTRDRAYAAGMILLTGLATATAIGMSVPLFQALAKKAPKVVEEHLYHLILSYFFVPFVLLLAVGPFISWRSMGLRELFVRTNWVISLSMGVLGAILILFKHPTLGVTPDMAATISFGGKVQVPAMFWLSFLLWICILAVVANLWRLVEMWKRSKLGLGPFVAHMGVASLMAGLIVSRGFEHKAEVFIQDGVPGSALGYTITYKTHTSGFTDRENKMLFDVQGPGTRFEARPGMYYTFGQDGEVKPTVWPHIQRFASHDLYLSLFPQVLEASDSVTLRPGETRSLLVSDFGKGEQFKVPVTYVKATQEGNPGTPGAKFGAVLKIALNDGTVTTNPTMELTETGMRKNPDVVNDDYYVTVGGMNANDKSVAIALGFIRPIYPIELYYKPLTILVWLGTALMLLGGVLSTLSRRFRPRPGNIAPISESDTIVEQNNATVATP